MPCRCDLTDDAIVAPPSGPLRYVDDSPEQWAELWRCGACGQHWKIEFSAGSGGGENLAFKVTDASTWLDYDTAPPTIALRTRQAGGTGDGKCLQRGCSDRPLKGKAFCAAHL